jgi:hypothetical protein
LKLLLKVVKLCSNLLIDGAPEDEVLLCLDLMKMAKLAYPIPSSAVGINFDSKTMRTNLKLLEGDPKSMHLVLKCVGGANNKVISELQEVLCIKGHPRA